MAGGHELYSIRGVETLATRDPNEYMNDPGLEDHWLDMLQALEWHLINTGDVLIGCRQGCNRGPAMTALRSTTKQDV